VIAVDTNVLVRLLTADDKAQFAKARRLFETSDIFVPVTVLLETEWVLRYSYAFETAAITEAFKRLLGLPNVEIHHGLAVRQAMGCYEQGMDFADALHLGLSVVPAASFASFDKALLKQAKKLGIKELMPL
jgi:predicted nucleic-acid-binding protein